MKRFLLFGVLCAFVLSPAVYGQPEKKITSVDDIPRFTYDVSNTVTELVTSEEAFTPLAKQVRADIENLILDIAYHQLISGKVPVLNVKINQSQTFIQIALQFQKKNIILIIGRNLNIYLPDI